MQEHDEEGPVEPHRRQSVGDVFPVTRGAPEDDAYEKDDPKHPDYHSRMSDLWDMREGK